MAVHWQTEGKQSVNISEHSFFQYKHYQIKYTKNYLDQKFQQTVSKKKKNYKMLQNPDLQF